MYHLREARIERHMTQGEAAAALGLSVSAYRRIERGQRKRIPLPLLCAIGDLYEARLDDLFGRTEARRPHA